MKSIIKLTKTAVELATYIVLTVILMLASFKMHDEGEGLLLFCGVIATGIIATKFFDKW
jgi:hypothetical protein